MKSQNILLDKSLNFAKDIVKTYQFLSKQMKENTMSKQLLRSGTSIGANANEAAYAISKADFIAKLQISLKETAETEYWLRLLMITDYLSESQGSSLLAECLEIKRILVSSLNTVKENNK